MTRRTLIFKLNKGEGEDELDPLSSRIRTALESNENKEKPIIVVKTLKRALVILKQSFVTHGLIYLFARQQMRALICHMRTGRLSSKEVENNTIQKNFLRPLKKTRG